MSPIVRNILGQVKTRVSFDHILRNHQIFIANLSKSHLGDERANLLGSLLVSQLQLAAVRRADQPVAERKPFGLAIDEFQNFVTESLGSVLSESRKYGLHLTLSHQYIDQVRQDIRDAVFGNVGALISFRIGHSDADRIAKEMATVPPEVFTNLSRFEVVAKLQVAGTQMDAFSARSLPPIG